VKTTPAPSAHYPVAIVGAGPSGVAAALALERAGIASVLLDKARFPRDKICGDALSPDVVHQIDDLESIAPGIGARFRASTAKIEMPGLRVVSPTGKIFDMELKHARRTLEGYVMPRLDFDTLLVDSVRGAQHIHLVENWSLETIEREGDVWVLRSAEGCELRSTLLIGADGVHSTVAKKLGVYELDRRHHCAAMRVYCEGVEWDRPDPLIELHFIRDVLPGYLWVFPLPGGRANVGIGMRSDQLPQLNKPLRQVLEEALRNHPHLGPRFAKATMLESIKGMGIPLGSKKRRLSGAGYLLCGDAASLVDPLTGEGIGNALRSGTYAGEQAVRALETGLWSASDLADYDRRVYGVLWGELRLSALVQQWFASARRIDAVLGLFERNPRLRRWLYRLLLDDSYMTHWNRPRYYLRKLGLFKTAG